MCGILGTITNEKHEINLVDFKKNLDLTSHRGPDTSNIVQYFQSNLKITFGHNRLSILDLSSSGLQPMESRSGRLSCIFNGEIYNHLELRKKFFPDTQWRGTSDTETVIELIDKFGIKKSLQLIEGMYSVALLDKRANKLFLFRDRAGEKPLYIYLNNNILGFSSDILNLKKLPFFKKNINYSAVKALTEYNYIPYPMSIFNNIFKLPPACMLSFELDRFELKNYVSFNELVLAKGVEFLEYWNIRLENNFDKFSCYEEARNTFDSLMTNAVNKLMISDVPIGAFLSGGIDSSLVVALLSQSNNNLKTFNIGFEFNSFDESIYANRIAKFLGTNHTSHMCTKEDAIETIQELPRAYTEPFADSSQIPTLLVSKIASDHVKVVLTGDAGDELFGGYNRYLYSSKFWKYIKILPKNSRRLLSNFITRIPRIFLDNSLIKKATMNYSGGIDSLVSKIASRLSHADSPETLYETFVKEWIDQDIISSEFQQDLVNYNELNFGNKELEDEMMLYDFKTYLTDDILCKVDRASMYFSLESRVPFLDKSIINFSRNLGTNHKIKNNSGKFILKDTLNSYVPKELFDRPKQGFGVPVDIWMRDELKEWADYYLSYDFNSKHMIFDHDKVSMAWEEHASGLGNNFYKLWSIIQFNQWYETHYVN